MAKKNSRSTSSHNAYKEKNEIVDTEVEQSNTAEDATLEHPLTEDTPTSDRIPTGFHIDSRSSGSVCQDTPYILCFLYSLDSPWDLRSNFGSSVFVFVVGTEKRIFAVHQETLTAGVLIDMCAVKTRSHEKYRIELPDVDPEIFKDELVEATEVYVSGRADGRGARGEDASLYNF